MFINKKSVVITRVLEEDGSSAARRLFSPYLSPLPHTDTEPKCKLMLAKSPESAHKKIGADRSSNSRVIL